MVRLAEVGGEGDDGHDETSLGRIWDQRFSIVRDERRGKNQGTGMQGGTK